MLDRITTWVLRRKNYRQLLLDNNGKMKPEAKFVLADLYKIARVFNPGAMDPQTLAATEGARQVVAHILKCARLTNKELERHLTSEGDNYA